MPEVTIVYWRDIPAQVIVGNGRRASKMPMPERFELAIDRCAMRAGARELGRLPRRVAQGRALPCRRRSGGCRFRRSGAARGGV